MTEILYRWPAAAEVSRPVPKNSFYEHANVSAAVRDRFVGEVQRITWAYKLAEITVNLPGSAEVPEIQVFRIDAKGDDVSDTVLTAVDAAVPSLIIFEIVAADRRVRMAAQLGGYHTTPWQNPDAPRRPLPTAISLSSLYTALVQPLIAVALQPGEEVSAAAARLEAIRKLEREVAVLQRKLRAEPQLNRKVEMRRALKTKQVLLEDLTSSGTKN